MTLPIVQFNILPAALIHYLGLDNTISGRNSCEILIYLPCPTHSGEAELFTLVVSRDRAMPAGGLVLFDLPRIFVLGGQAI